MKKRVISVFAILFIMLGMVMPHFTSLAETQTDTSSVISAGATHSMAVKANGSLWAWGKNEFGQLGDGTATDKNTPVRIMGGVIAVSAGSSHTAAINIKGSLWAWGNNRFGRLGDGTTTNRHSPVKIMDDVSAVSTWNHTIAIKTDGSLWAWGNNRFGQLGDGTATDRNTPVKIIDDVIAVSAGGDHTTAIKTDGSLWAWGKNDYGQLGDGTINKYDGIFSRDDNNKYTPVKIMDDVIAVSAGGYHTTAIKTDGSLWAWGWFLGLFNDDATIDKLTPVKIMDDVIAVSVGDHIVAVKADSSLWRFDYLFRELGDPVKIMDGVKLPGKTSVSAPSNPSPPTEEVSIKEINISSFGYQQVSPFSEGLAGVEINEQVGYIDSTGKLVIPMKYYVISCGCNHEWGEADSFSEGMARVGSSGGNYGERGRIRIGFIDKTGSLTIPMIYDFALPFSDGLAVVQKDDKVGFIDKNGKVVIPMIYDWASSFSDGLAIVGIGDWEDLKYGSIDKNGNIIIPFEYGTTVFESDVDTTFSPDISGFSEGLAAVRKDGKWGFIDKTNRLVIPAIYDNANAFSEGFAAVEKDGKWGFIDKAGNVMIPLNYDWVDSFSEGLATVRTGDWNNWGNMKYGFIDKTGNVIIPLNYDWALSFSDGLATVRKGGNWYDYKYGFMDKTGRLVVPMIYDSVSSFSEGIVIAEKREQWPPNWYLLHVENIVQIPDTPDAPNPSYIYEPVTPSETVIYTLTPRAFTPIRDTDTAISALNSFIKNLTPEQRTSGDALDESTLWIEHALKNGTRQTVTGNTVTVDLNTLALAISRANEICAAADSFLSTEDIELLRNYRTNLLLDSDQEQSLRIEYGSGINSLNFDRITVSSPFASVTANRSALTGNSSVQVTALTDSTDTATTQEKSTNRNRLSPLQFWGIVPILGIALIWVLMPTLREKMNVRFVIVAIVLIVLVNVLTFIFIKPSQSPDTDNIGIESTQDYRQIPRGVELELDNISQVTLSIPIADNENPEYMMVFDKEGQPVYSKYNPATNMVDARVKQSGVYVVKENKLSFVDIEKKNDMMREAIYQLASKGIMAGTTDGMFFPDKMITRAEFVSAIVRMFDLLDVTAESTFDDIDKADWYYSAAASAHRENIITGFDDNTFRGDLDMPKDQMIVASSNTLVEQMGYRVPKDIETLLSRYIDRDEIATWTEGGIALATQANVLIYRTDSRFAPEYPMTRGDAAIILNRVFMKIW